MGSHCLDGSLCWHRKQRIKSQGSETDQIAQMTIWAIVQIAQNNNFCFLTGAYLLKATRPPQFQTSGYVTTGLSNRLKINHPFREFFIGGVKERPHQKGRTLALLKGQSPSLFPLINFPFLAWLPACSLFLCTRLSYIRPHYCSILKY